MGRTYYRIRQYGSWRGAEDEVIWGVFHRADKAHKHCEWAALLAAPPSFRDTYLARVGDVDLFIDPDVDDYDTLDESEVPDDAWAEIMRQALS